MQQPRIPVSSWCRLDDRERALVDSYIDSLVCANYQKEKTRIMVRVIINRGHELVPPPLLFATLTAFFSFAALFILPAQPISMAIAFGGGLAAALITQAVVNVSTWWIV